MHKYTTTRGIEVEFLPIPQALVKFRATHPQPEPPTYEVMTLGGVSEVHAHNETTLDVPDNPEETSKRHALWEEYQGRVSIYNSKFLRICLLRGIVVHASMDEWIAEQKALELPITEDPLELKMEWLTDQVVTTREDYQAVLLGVMRATEVPEDLLKQIEALFRGEVGQSERADSESITISENEQAVVLQPALGGSSGRLQDGDTVLKIPEVVETGSRHSDDGHANGGTHASVGSPARTRRGKQKVNG